MEERVGVVIPTYNTGEMVIAAAESAYTALGTRANVIVVDDGSTDEATRRSLANLDRAGYRLLRQANGGVSNARNAGLALLTTPYAFVLDSDDRLDPAAPCLAADILDARPEVVIVAGAGTEFDGSGYVSAPHHPGHPDRDQMWHGTLIATASAFRVADWRRCGGFPAGLAMGEDWVFWMRLLTHGGVIAVSEETFVHRRMHPGQATKRYIDPRHSAKAQNLVLRENPDLAAAHRDELFEELARTREVLAAYRHTYRHLGEIKAKLSRAKRLVGRRVR